MFEGGKEACCFQGDMTYALACVDAVSSVLRRADIPWPFSKKVKHTRIPWVMMRKVTPESCGSRRAGEQELQLPPPPPPSRLEGTEGRRAAAQSEEVSRGPFLPAQEGSLSLLY